MCIEGTTIVDPGILAEKFNNYFTGIAQSLVDKLPHSTESFDSYLSSPRPNSIAVLPTSAAEIMNISHSLKTTHSMGLDDIDPSIMKPIVEYVATPLSHIYNCSFFTGIVPPALKIAKVVPIFNRVIRKV